MPIENNLSACKQNECNGLPRLVGGKQLKYVLHSPFSTRGKGLPQTRSEREGEFRSARRAAWWLPLGLCCSGGFAVIAWVRRRPGRRDGVRLAGGGQRQGPWNRSGRASAVTQFETFKDPRVKAREGVVALKRLLAHGRGFVVLRTAV